MMRQNPRRALRLLLPLLVLALAGCAREAPATSQEPAFERPAAPDARGLGDPNAPIAYGKA